MQVRAKPLLFNTDDVMRGLSARMVCLCADLLCVWVHIGAFYRPVSYIHLYLIFNIYILYLIQIGSISSKGVDNDRDKDKGHGRDKDKDHGDDIDNDNEIFYIAI